MDVWLERLADTALLHGDEDGVVDLTERDVPLLGRTIVSEDPRKVEVARGLDGVAIAARVHGNDDEDFPGSWRTIGVLTISSGRCVVFDPGEQKRQVEFLMAPGAYDVEVRDVIDEAGTRRVVGLRIRR